MAETELSVVCKNCGSEVSPYVTECPYCGTRLRKRAPKLERRGDELSAQESRACRRRRKRRERKERKRRERGGLSLAAERAYVTIGMILAPARAPRRRAGRRHSHGPGARRRPPGFADTWWRYLAAPFVYDNAGYLFAIGVAIALFVPGLERRLGTVPTALLLVACGSLGMLAAPGLDSAFGDGFTIAGGGNGIALGALAAWFVFRRADARADPTEELDMIPIVVVGGGAAPPAAGDDYANQWAGIAGGLVGLAAGARRRTPRAALDRRCLTSSHPHARAPRLPGRPRRARRTTSCGGLPSETDGLGDIAVMQSAPEQVALMTLLCKAMAGGGRSSWAPSPATRRSASRGAWPRAARSSPAT